MQLKLLWWRKSGMSSSPEHTVMWNIFPLSFACVNGSNYLGLTYGTLTYSCNFHTVKHQQNLEADTFFTWCSKSYDTIKFLIFLVAVLFLGEESFVSLFTWLLSPTLPLISSPNSKWLQHEFIYSFLGKWDLLTLCWSSQAAAAAAALIGSCEMACLPTEIMDRIN